jgi:hypothetical protein
MKMKVLPLSQISKNVMIFFLSFFFYKIRGQNSFCLGVSVELVPVGGQKWWEKFVEE